MSSSDSESEMLIQALVSVGMFSRTQEIFKFYSDLGPMNSHAFLKDRRIENCWAIHWPYQYSISGAPIRICKMYFLSLLVRLWSILRLFSSRSAKFHFCWCYSGIPFLTIAPENLAWFSDDQKGDLGHRLRERYINNWINSWMRVIWSKRRVKDPICFLWKVTCQFSADRPTASVHHVHSFYFLGNSHNSTIFTGTNCVTQTVPVGLL